MLQKLIEADSVYVHAGQKPLLKKFSFTISRKQAWALVGPSGSGKTLLSQVIMNRFSISSGTLRRYIDPDAPMVMVEQQSQYRSLSGAAASYYQARFNSCSSEDSPLLEDKLMQVVQKNKASGHLALSSRIDEVLRLLGIEYLRKTRLVKLSNGENKRFQLAKAILQHPCILILDNPFVGLDREARQMLHQVINHLITEGMVVVLITTPAEIPAGITHVMELEAGTVKQIHTRNSFLDQQRHRKNKLPSPSFHTEVIKAVGDSPFRQETFTVAVKMQEVSVRYGDRKILDGVHWQINRGDQWALTGPNGAGKSTLLSLISGDHPQAYANDICLFDRKRGSGESIWDIKRKIGFISPELHLYFNRSMPCFDAIATGFSDKMVVAGKLNDAQKTQISLWMKLLEIPHLEKRRLNDISLGEQRLVLLARALVKNPLMLILDEPCQGLDAGQTVRFTQLLDAICQHFDKTMIYVSHYPEDIPPCINHHLFLEEGKVKEIG